MRPSHSRNKFNRKYTAYVVPHTHWDRAWYLPFEEFRIKLVRMFDKLLRIYQANPRFSAFSFDGQTIVIEDYLQIRPETERRIRRLVKDGRLAIGPWYVLPDEFLVSGEAMIRNLLVGHTIARNFGKVMKAGYIPDPFGHISQMPQILRGFGIDSMIFSRGSGRRVREAGLVFKWFGADEQSWVYGVRQAGMYGDLMLWGVPEGEPVDTLAVDHSLALQQVQNLIALIEKRKNSTSALLFNNGHDHLAAQPTVPELIDYVNENQEQAYLVQGTFEDFVGALRKDTRSLVPVSGEMHEGMDAVLLSGIFSARMYLKQANASAQTLLEKFSEPLATFAWTLGAPYPGEFLLHAWKELLRCHPHDDIGGCSVDSVHDEDMDRFGRVQQIGGILARESLEHIARQVSGQSRTSLVVYNPLGFSNSGEVKITTAIQRQEVPQNPRLLDQRNREIPAVIEWSAFPDTASKPSDPETGELRISFLAENLPPCGYRVYTLGRGEKKKPARSSRSADSFIENEFFKITPNSDGTIDLKDKETGVKYKRLNFFEDTEDAGDEYDYSPLPEPHTRTVTSSGKRARVSVVRSVPYRQSLEVSLALRIPCSLTRSRKSRARRMVSLPIRSTVTLYRGIRRVDFETTVDNRACDHRLRAGFPTGIRTAFADAESKFDVVRRQIRFPKYTKKYRQPPVPTQHVETFVDIHDGKRGFALLNQGLPEYEAREEADGITIYQTLFRSIGWLSRPDLVTRGRGNVGPQFPTPGAQMPGKWTFRYGIVPHRGTWEDAELWQVGQSFTSPVLGHFCETGGGTLPPESSFVSIDPSSVLISAIKRSESGEGIVVRFYNLASRKVRATVRFFRPITQAHLTRLDETRLKPLKVLAGNSVAVPVGAKGIVTLEIQTGS